jgi:molybdenum cofactor guanylyltransferase
MVPGKENITGIVLAGGKSSRMGTDKSLMLFRDKPLIQHAIDIIAPLCCNVVISSNKNIYDFTGCETWADEIQVQAPLVGIYSCLKKSDTEFNLVISCDMPFLNNSLFQFLLSQSNNYDIVIPRHQKEYLEPLSGVYRKSCLPAMKEKIDSNNFGIQNLILSANSFISDIDSAQTFFLESMFLNINTLQDYYEINNL